MDSIRSIVWIGDERLAVALAADCPTLELVWERDVAGARALPLGDFDALLLACEDSKQAFEALEALSHRRPLPPIFLQLESAGDLPLREFRERGAADVFCCGADPTARALKRALFQGMAKIDRSAKPSVAVRVEGSQRQPSTKIVGTSPQIAEVLALIEHASRSRVTVLITGETGTGKELLAREIHEKSSIREAPFVAVNCAAFPESLLESELFGHQRGAFTGADRDKSGLFEAANGGTLFLDEIGETTRPFQAKLLRVLQEREVRPIGSSRTRKINVRVVAATNRNLRREASDAQFRPDLYYRLAVFPIHVPPLRERPADILPLANHFLSRYGKLDGRPGALLSGDSRHLLQSYGWPGNVRELENEIQRALAVSGSDDELTPAQFSTRLLEVLEPVQAVVQPGDSLRETLARVEAWLIRHALEANSGRRATTARLLGITREGLYKKMKRHGIT
ncbi:MAG: sigma 54-interacting transcriptional regulator [Deltaproteobacteria bacterium]|nr:sigma 54-interacting transcriptional regulator [Deltaproteobacteria bacterium]MBW2578047.1 sigma 54-interacting transcriptional regulator [Deltaproteobacteria bacterium]MBW2692073.1 sigma 54-interacting transcriptional regulator [Deltaproteobacteria bacterium]